MHFAGHQALHNSAQLSFTHWPILFKKKIKNCAEATQTTIRGDAQYLWEPLSMSCVQQKSNMAHILDIAMFCVLPFYSVWPLLSVSLSISQCVFTLLFPPLLFFFCLPLHASCWWHFLGERLVCGWVTGTVTLHVAGLGCRSAVPDGRLVYRRRRDATSWLFQNTAVLEQDGGWGHDCADTSSWQDTCVCRLLEHLKPPRGWARYRAVSRHRRAEVFTQSGVSGVKFSQTCQTAQPTKIKA